MRDFPVFADEGDPENRRVIKIENVPEDEVRTLAPVRGWKESLQPFSELFPRRHIIADEFFQAVSDEQVWVALDAQRFCKRECHR